MFIYVMCVCLYLQLFVEGLMSYLCYVCSSLPSVVCRRAHVLFMLFVFVLPPVVCRRAHVLFMLFVFVFTPSKFVFTSPVVCRRANVLFMLFVFVFTSSCL